MSVTPKALASSLQKQANKRTSLIEVGEIKPSSLGDGFVFACHDNDGGILIVHVIQYKEPIR